MNPRLRTSGPLLAGAIAGAALLFAVASLWPRARADAESALRQHAEALATLQAARTEVEIASLRATVGSTFGSDRRLSSLVQHLKSATGDEGEARLAAVRALLGAQAAALPVPAEWTLLDAAGTVLARSGSAAERPSGDDASRTDCFQQLGAGEATFTGLRARPGAVGQISLAAPVREAKGALLGVLCLELELTSRPQLLATHREGWTPMVFLVDRAGCVLDASVHDHQDPRMGRPLVGLPVDLAGRTTSWRGEYAPPGRPGVFGAFVPMAALGYGVLVEAQVEGGRAAVGGLTGAAVALGVAAAGLLLGAALWLGQRAARSKVPEAGPSPPHPGLFPAPSPGGAPPRAPGLQPAPSPSDRGRGLELDSSLELSELLLSALDSRVAVVGPDFRVLRANAAALQRYYNLLSFDAHQLFEGGPGPCKSCPMCQAFATGKPVAVEGSEGAGSLTELVQVQVLPVRSARGKVVAVLRLSRVVTAEKQLQAQLMLREKMSAFGLIAAGVAHEIGNPLAAIISQLRLAREAPEPGRTEATLEVVSREVTRIQGLLRDLVNFARRPRTGHSLVSLDTVVDDVWRLLSHEPRARNVTIERKSSSSPPAVRAQEDHLVQVLLNLGINALDAMPEGGTLTFATAVEADSALVRVTDTGKGIAPEVHARLFEPFFTTKEAGHGTGLGLFVSKGIVRELKGSLVVERTGPDGTVFCLRLPLAAHE